MWFKALQIAIIERDAQKIMELVETPLNFANLEQAREAQYLLAEASALMHELKDETYKTMQQIKKNRDFLKSTQSKTPHKFDIKS
ncbi:MAG TPA: hypothetical protein CFH84_11680 [Sulfurimonas sp. UBA12504]|nr:MAG TPA: hypothetical protein CFH84_11680 [Sulfurimonas sp. UBA12504]